MADDLLIGYADLTDALDGAVTAVTGSQMRRALTAGGLIIEREAKINVRSQGLIESGRLRNSITTQAEDDSTVVVGVFSLVYAAIHEFGGVITAKASEWLHFKLPNGDWVMTKSVTIPARPYLRPAYDNNIDKVVKAIGDTLLSFIKGAANE